MWQDCIDTGIIFIEEPVITPEIVEQCKLVFEGAATHVHVKMRGDSLLQPTPVIITSNSLPWKWCGAEEGALRARMFIRFVKEQPWLKDIKKPLHPGIWMTNYIIWTEEKKLLDDKKLTEDEMKTSYQKVQDIRLNRNMATITIPDDDVDDETLEAAAAAYEKKNDPIWQQYADPLS